jgi:Flp pilus assembly protein TadG
VNYNTGTLTVESGAVVDASSATLTVTAAGTTTLNIGLIKLNNIRLGGSVGDTVQLNSPLYITGTAFLGAASQGLTINGSPVYIESGVLTSNGGSQGTVLGTSQIIMTGDKATYLDNAIPVFTNGTIWRLPITINIRGTFLMVGRLVLSTGGSLNIGNGNVENRDGLVNRASLLVQANTTLTNVHKCKFKNITITAGVTLTMNEFFTGSPEFKSIIRSTSTGNYTVTFTDRVPKKAFHVNVRNCNVTQTLVRNQLNIINRDGNAGFNSGIIFGESGMCGFPLNKFPTEVSYPTDNGFKNGFN